MLRHGLTTAIALAHLLASTQAQESRPEHRRPRVEDLLPGNRLKAKVVPDASGAFRSSDLELLPLGGRDSVLGPIEAAREGRLTISGIRIDTTRETEWRDEGRNAADPTAFRPQDWVKVDGRFHERGRLRARRIRVEKPRDRASLEGRLEWIEPSAEGWRLRLLGVDVLVPAGTRVDVPQELEEIPLASLTEEPPSRRRRTEEDFIPGSIRFGERLTLGGTITTKVERERDFDLDVPPMDRENRWKIPLRTRIEATARPSDRVFLVAGFEQERSWRLNDDEFNSKDRRTNLRETFVFVRDVGLRGFDLEAGRLHFRDDRQWLYDRDLDGARLSFDRNPWHAEISLTTVVFGGRRRLLFPAFAGVSDRDAEKDEETTNVIAAISRDLRGRGEFSAFLVDRKDRGREDDSPLLGGLRARFEPLEDFEAWADLAVATGSSAGRLAPGQIEHERIRGYGIDLGATWVPPLPLEPSLTAGYAFGSGGDRDPSDGNSNFRQTGLHDNTGRWNGVTTFRLYGELFDPELSNLSIATLGLGFRPGRRTSLDLVAHRYTQSRPAAFLRENELDATPDGARSDIGREFDAILGWREIRHLDVEVVYGRFEPGEAFPSERAAQFFKFEVRFKF